MNEKLFILTKTYPMPSRDYREHTCVAAINDKGELRRLYPVPFRLLENDLQFKRWQWISAEINRSSDQRPESHRINTDTIKILSEKPLAWPDRMAIIKPHIFSSFNALEEARIKTGMSFGIIQPLDYMLEIEEEKNKAWTIKELANLNKEGLFDPDGVKSRRQLRKLPYKFYYRYKSPDNGEESEFRHMVTDWESGILCLNCIDRYKDGWETKVREKLEGEFKNKRKLFFLMGTVHRFPSQWLIVGLIYPPKNQLLQEPLFIPAIND